MVVRVPLLAGQARGAAGGTLVVHSAALLVDLDGASAGAAGRGGRGSRGTRSGRSRGGGSDAGGEGRHGGGLDLGGRRGGRRDSGGRGSGSGRGSCLLSAGCSGSTGAGARARRARARRSAVPNGRARDGVGVKGAVDVEENALVGGSVGTRQTDTLRQLSGTVRGDLELDALHVELRAPLAVALMQGDDLRTEEVVTGRHVGDSHRVLALVGDESVDGPCTVVVSVLIDLDPVLARRAGLRGGHVDEDRALVGVGDDVVRGIAGVVVPLEGDLVTSGDFEGLRSGLVAVNVTGEVSRSHVGDGAVAGGCADVAISGVAEALVFVIDPDSEDGGVGSDEFGARCQSEDAGELHVDRMSD